MTRIGGVNNKLTTNKLYGWMTRHCDCIVSDVEEVQFDGGEKSEVVRILGLELLRRLEAVDKLSHLLVACFGADTVHHLHLDTPNTQISPILINFISMRNIQRGDRNVILSTQKLSPC